jgi:hypothetical protein
VLQVVSATTTTEVTVTSSTATDSTLTATITPSSATSKILIMISQSIRVSRATNSITNAEFRVFRGATLLSGYVEYLVLQAGTDGAGSISLLSYVPFMQLDSPNTTSATTYKTQISTGYTANSGTVKAQTNSGISSITLLEIGA